MESEGEVISLSTHGKGQEVQASISALSLLNAAAGRNQSEDPSAVSFRAANISNESGLRPRRV